LCGPDLPPRPALLLHNRNDYRHYHLLLLLSVFVFLAPLAVLVFLPLFVFDITDYSPLLLQ
jgi:hypothetical protein